MEKPEELRAYIKILICILCQTVGNKSSQFLIPHPTSQKKALSASIFYRCSERYLNISIPLYIFSTQNRILKYVSELPLFTNTIHILTKMVLRNTAHIFLN